MRRTVLTIIAAAMLGAALMLSGCSYMADRYDDSLDMFDTGILVADTWKPGFACYIDFFQYLPTGYSYVPHARLLGMAQSQIGFLPVKHYAWGYIIDGTEHKQFGEFNPLDPRQVSPELADKVTTFQQYNAGYLKPSDNEKPAPFLQHFECDRFFYLGWMGFCIDIRPLDIGDFLCGWFGIDYMHDDDMPRKRWNPWAEPAVQPATDKAIADKTPVQ